MADISSIARISVKKEERLYTFECENNSNIGEIYDVLQEMKNCIFQQIQQNEQSQKKEEPKPE